MCYLQGYDGYTAPLNAWTPAGGDGGDDQDADAHEGWVMQMIMAFMRCVYQVHCTALLCPMARCPAGIAAVHALRSAVDTTACLLEDAGHNPFLVARSL